MRVRISSHLGFRWRVSRPDGGRRSRINSHSAPCTKLTETLWSSKPPSPAEQSTEQSRREAERGLCGSCFALYFASKNKCGANLPPCSTTERTHRREQRNTPYVSDGPVRDPRLCMCLAGLVSRPPVSSGILTAGRSDREERQKVASGILSCGCERALSSRTTAGRMERGRRPSACIAASPQKE